MDISHQTEKVHDKIKRWELQETNGSSCKFYALITKLEAISTFARHVFADIFSFHQIVARHGIVLNDIVPPKMTFK